MRNIRPKLGGMAAALAVAVGGFAIPALATTVYFSESPPAVIVAEPARTDLIVTREVVVAPLESGMHEGATSLSDARLMAKVVAALQADSRLDGASVTVVADKGQITLSGSGRDLTQAMHAEQTAREIAGFGNVSGTLDVQGG